MSTPAVLALQDGTIFRGVSVGAEGKTIGEVVFNTAMTGYQEILTDPSYCRQIVTLTYPHIGNTGTNSDDMESSMIHASGLIIRDSSMMSSSWRSERSFSDFLVAGGTVAIGDIDTRRLTRILREKGAQSGCIMTGEIDAETAIEHANKFPGIAGMDLAKFLCTIDSDDKRPECQATALWLIRQSEAAQSVCDELERMAADGARLIDTVPRVGAGGDLVAFIHPKSTNGVLTELKLAR